MTSVRCPLCGSDRVDLFDQAQDIEYYTSSDTFDFYRCPPCDILFIHPMLHDRLGDIYPANYYSYQDGPQTLVARVKERIDRRAYARLSRGLEGPSLAALDVGGGRGWLLDQLRRSDKRFDNTWIVDLDAKAADTARAHGHHFHLGRFEEFEPAGMRFDVILMLNLIEHVADPRAVLAKARDLLSDRGRMWLKTPNFDALDRRLFTGRSWAGYHTPRHFVLFTLPSLKRLCGEVGLGVVSAGYTQGAPFWSVSLLHELKKLGLAEVSADRPAIYHPLMPYLQMAAAAFDYLRLPVSKLSQMNFVLEKRR
jgi:SAM-dependent methyltransferase